MNEFIKTLYGVALAVSFFRIASSEKAHWDIIPFNNISGFSINNYFSIFLFSFTIIIGAHDWYSYHRSTLLSNRSRFIEYLPQIFSLLFFAQMIDASVESIVNTDKNFRLWYLCGLGYTACNLIIPLCNFFSNRDRSYFFFFKYVSHILLCLGYIFFLFPNKNVHTPDNYSNIIYLGITIAVVVTLWLTEDPLRKDKNFLQGSSDLQSEIQADNSSPAKTIKTDSRLARFVKCFKSFNREDKLDLTDPQSFIISLERILKKEKCYLKSKLFLCGISLAISFSILLWRLLPVLYGDAGITESLDTLIAPVFGVLFSFTISAIELMDINTSRQRLLAALKPQITGGTFSSSGLRNKYLDLLTQLTSAQHDIL